MPAYPTAAAPSKGLSNEWLLGICIALATLLVGMGVWMYTALGDASFSSRPKPVWLGVPKVISQMSDGRVMEVKVNLQLKDKDAAGNLRDHLNAFSAMIQEVGSSMTKTDIRGADGVKEYGRAIRESLNDYLEERQISTRVKHVAFEELTLVH